MSTQQQTTACEQMAETVSEVRDVAAQVATGAQETERATNELMELAESLRDLMETDIQDKGKVAAVDSLDNLTSASSGKTFIRIDGDQQAIRKELDKLDSVKSVDSKQRESGEADGFIIALDGEKRGRKSIHAMIEKNDWHLEEMRPVESNLEDDR